MKNKKIKKLKTFTISSIFGMMIGSVAFAEDIEIYTGNKGGESQSNVMFIIDSSGSMGWYGRMDRLKTELTSTLDLLPDRLKAGITSYNGAGGSVLYPADRLSNISSGNFTAYAKELNDAVEVSTGAISQGEPQLFFNAVSTVRVESRVDASSRDAEQCSDRTNYTTNGVLLELAEASCDVSSNQFNNVGMIFRNLNIPRNAKIVDARIELTHNQYYTTNNQSDVEIVIEDSSTPNNYGRSGGGRGGVVRRNFFNSGNLENIGKISWLPVVSSPVGTIEQTPNVSNLVQSVVNRADWNQLNNAINLTIRGIAGGRTGRTSFSSYNFNPAQAPKLIIEYETVSSANVSGGNKIAIRFDSVQVPSLVNLDNAYLEVTPVDNKVTGDMKLSILASASSDEISNSTNDISNRTVVDVINYSVTDWRAGEPYRFNISDALLRHFSRSDWCGGNNLMFVLESPNLGGIEAKETVSGTESKLYIKYDGADSNACGVKDSNYQVSSSSDDGYSFNSDNFITQSTLIVGNGYTTAIRFDSLPLLQGDEIVDARIEFVSALDNGTPIEIDVFADVTNLNNPNPYLNVDGSRITDRNTSLIGGTRIGFDATIRNNKYRSENIAETINLAVSRGDWSQGNALSLILKSSNSNLKHFYSNDFDLSEAPKLFLKVKQTGAFAGSTVRDNLKTIIQQIEPNSGTPTLGSTLETFDYFLGNDVTYGMSRNNNRLKRVSSEKSWTGGEIITPADCPEDNPNSENCREERITGSPVYNTPVSTAVCETNNIIMITDGEPTTNAGVYGRVNTLTGKACATEWDCIYDITQHMAEKDHFSNINGVQNIMTNVIGFDFDVNSQVYANLEEYARIGQGQFFNVDDGAGLSNALELITDNILDVETTIATPGVSVNQNNKFQFLNELYYSVFKPSKFKSWDGNLKKYKIVGTDTTGEDFEIIDVNGNPAIDRETGFFREDSQSFWSSQPDGESVVNGGSASKLISGRNLFTYLDNSVDMRSVSLNSDNYKLRSFNTELTPSDFNVSETWVDADLQRFLNWVEGQDIFDEDEDGSTTDARTKMGAPLHSQPIVVSYDDNNSTVFVGTNEGFLHGIDAESGKELFAFMPKDLLPNLYKRYRNVVGPHTYGIDNTWIAYRNDADKDGTIGNNNNDFVYIYGGMRRGGNSLFSLDVTNVKGSNISSNIHPKVNWIIDNTTSPEFSNLGQSWSVPVLARVKYNGADKVVMIFGGGYDSSHDNPNVINSTDTLGKQVYVVDAISGQLLWWASASGTGANEEVAGMNHSITGKVNVIDLDNDGYADYMYVGDLGGQVLKFRINKDNTGESNFADGKIFAKLGKTDGTVAYNFANNRRIYEKIALVPIENSTEKYMAVVASTGYRAKPLEVSTEDGIFVLKDFEIIDNEFNVNETVILDNLLDVTFREDPETINADLTDKKGYKIWLIEGTNDAGIFLGEKTMGETVVFNGSIIFTTYFPQSEPKACSPVTGVSRSYSINLLDGTPTGLFDNESETLNDETLNQKRYVEQRLPGIASGTKILYTKDGVIALTNTDAKGLGFQSGLGIFKSSWYPKSEKNDVVLPLEIPPHLRGN